MTIDFNKLVREHNDTPKYTINGVILDGALEELPDGIYIARWGGNCFQVMTGPYAGKYKTHTGVRKRPETDGNGVPYRVTKGDEYKRVERVEDTITEDCDCGCAPSCGNIGGIGAPYGTLTNIPGVGNVVPAGINTYGSGDLLYPTFGTKKKSRKKSPKRKSSSKSENQKRIENNLQIPIIFVKK